MFDIFNPLFPSSSFFVALIRCWFSQLKQQLSSFFSHLDEFSLTVAFKSSVITTPSIFKTFIYYTYERPQHGTQSAYIRPGHIGLTHFFSQPWIKTKHMEVPWLSYVDFFFFFFFISKWETSYFKRKQTSINTECFRHCFPNNFKQAKMSKVENIKALNDR